MRIGSTGRTDGRLRGASAPLLGGLIAAIVTVWAGPSEARVDLTAAYELIQQGRADAAYRLLAPAEIDHAGDPGFDYALGLAALDTGRPDLAVIALERVLTVQPGHLHARAEIARAYFELGERESARREFETVRRQDVPEPVARTIDRYLSALDGRDTAPAAGTRISGFVSAGAGWDSNVNAGPSASQIAIPAFAGLGLATLDPAARRQSSGFGRVAAGINVLHPLSESVAVLGGVSGDAQRNARNGRFDTSTIDGNAGLAVIDDDDLFTAAAQAQRFWIDGRGFRNALGGVLQWRRSFDERNTASLFGQYTRLTYPGQSIRNANRWSGGIAYAHSFGGEEQPVMFASAYGGVERERASNVRHLGHGFVGVRIGGEVPIVPKVAAFGSLRFESRSYGGNEPLFLKKRRDRQTDASLGVAWTFADSWKLVVDGSYSWATSNIVIYDHRRARMSGTVRYEF